MFLLTHKAHLRQNHRAVSGPGEGRPYKKMLWEKRLAVVLPRRTAPQSALCEGPSQGEHNSSVYRVHNLRMRDGG